MADQYRHGAWDKSQKRLTRQRCVDPGQGAFNNAPLFGRQDPLFHHNLRQSRLTKNCGILGAALPNTLMPITLPDTEPDPMEVPPCLEPKHALYKESA